MMVALPLCWVFPEASALTVQEYVVLLRNAVPSNQNQTADASMQRIIDQVDKADPVAQVNLGIALNGVKNYAAAIKVLEHATTLAPKSALAYANLAYAAFWSDDCPKALPAFSRAIELSPEEKQEVGLWHSLAGRCHLRLKDYGRAQQSCLVAVNLRSSDPRGHICIGKALFGAAQYEAATAAFVKALGLTNDSLYRGEATMGALASLGKQNKLDSARSLLKLDGDPNYSKERIESSSVAAMRSLDQADRWQY